MGKAIPLWDGLMKESLYVYCPVSSNIIGEIVAGYVGWFSWGDRFVSGSVLTR